MFKSVLLCLTLLLQVVLSVRSTQADAINVINCLYLQGFPEDTVITLGPLNDLCVFNYRALNEENGYLQLKEDEFEFCGAKYGYWLRLSQDSSLKRPAQLTIIGTLIEVVTGQVELPEFTRYHSLTNAFSTFCPLYSAPY